MINHYTGHVIILLLDPRITLWHPILQWKDCSICTCLLIDQPLYNGENNMSYKIILYYVTEHIAINKQYKTNGSKTIIIIIIHD